MVGTLFLVDEGRRPWRRTPSFVGNKTRGGTGVLKQNRAGIDNQPIDIGRVRTAVRQRRIGHSNIWTDHVPGSDGSVKRSLANLYLATYDYLQCESTCDDHPKSASCAFERLFLKL
jgi:hypothetical protein